MAFAFTSIAPGLGHLRARLLGLAAQSLTGSPGTLFAFAIQERKKEMVMMIAFVITLGEIM